MLAALVSLMLGMGCGPTIVDVDGADSSTGMPTSSTTTTETNPPDSTSTSSTTGLSDPTNASLDSGGDDEDEDDTIGSFVLPTDAGDGIVDCDIFLQDCPIGQKCMPWANDGGGAWNATRCSTIVEDPGAPGDPCTVEESGVSGTDTCELATICWDVDPKTLEGTCIAFCSGSPANPICEDPGTSCAISSDGPLALCLPTCNPLTQDCPDGEGCYPFYDDFGCAPPATEAGGNPGDPCEYINACEPGNGCFSNEAVPGCEGSIGCCTAFCNIEDLEPPCLEGQECLMFYEEGTAPPGYEEVGFCGLP